MTVLPCDVVTKVKKSSMLKVICPLGRILQCVFQMEHRMLMGKIFFRGFFANTCSDQYLVHTADVYIVVSGRLSCLLVTSRDDWLGSNVRLVSDFVI